MAAADGVTDVDPAPTAAVGRRIATLRHLFAWAIRRGLSFGISLIGLVLALPLIPLIMLVGLLFCAASLRRFPGPSCKRIKAALRRAVSRA